MQIVFRVLFVCSLLLNIYLLFLRDRETVPAPAPAASTVTVDGITVTDGSTAGNKAPDEPAPAPPSEADGLKSESGASVASTAGVVVDKDTGARLLSLEVRGSFAETFNEALGREAGDLVSAVFSRIYMWKLDLKSDVRRGDRIDLVYRVIPDANQVDIYAARYHSKKLDQVLSAYWYKPADKPFGSFYDEKGNEIQLTLANSPIQGYEQITALLRDRTRHQGMDFKTPEGTQVVAPFRGRVTRINWNSPNGNCVEIEYSDSKLVAKFLHLSKILPGIVPGKVVAAGEPIAESGNTGHSTAPHLHYQLEKANGKIVDPLEFHKTSNVSLSSSILPQFEVERQRLDKLFNTGA